MRRKFHFKARHASVGASLIELALILPVLLILVLGVADFGRAILFNNILITMSREGANLASRTTENPKNIILALNFTANPLQMAAHGMVYITRVRGEMVGPGAGTLVAVVEEQYRATSGDMSLASKLRPCPSWNSATGQCNLPTATADRVVTLSLPLALNAEVSVVETTYHYSPMTNYVMKAAPDLYSWSLL
jgi:Flp pilus assembly protein TadG